MKRMNVQQLISLAMALLMAHPGSPGFRLWGAAAPVRGPRPITIVHALVAPAAAAAAAPAPGARKPVAAQVVVALPGQSVTTLPDGQILTLGGQSAAGAVARAALKPAAGVA